MKLIKLMLIKLNFTVRLVNTVESRYLQRQNQPFTGYRVSDNSLLCSFSYSVIRVYVCCVALAPP